jgi:hypothetical protein
MDQLATVYKLRSVTAVLNGKKEKIVVADLDHPLKNKEKPHDPSQRSTAVVRPGQKFPPAVLGVRIKRVAACT